MEKVNIVTIHFGTNHGSVLQAYALSNYLKSIGYDAKIIDYVPERYKIWNSMIKSKGNKYPLPVLLAYYPLAFLKSIRVRKIFERFLKNNLNLTKRYSSNSDLIKNPPKADIYVTGSDQVWNNDYNGNDDFTYFLNFVPENSKKIAYAASFGKEEITGEEYFNSIIPMLKNFDSISVRESTAKEILEEMDIDSTHVVDPVFLLSKKDWERFSVDRHTQKKYILVYVMDGLYQELLEYAELLKKQTGYEIVVLSFKKIKDKRIDRCYYLSNPKEFVGLVKNSDVIVTNSFHGTAFSILFQKKFVTIGKEKYNSRMMSLLKKLSLMKHFIPIGQRLNSEELIKLIERENIDGETNSLQKWINDSKEFISTSLGS